MGCVPAGQRQDTGEDWFRLDNAAKVYPAAFSAASPGVFRLFAGMAEPVRVAALEAALARVLPRFPYFQVHLRRGLFWYYLERHHEIPPLEVLEDGSVPAIPIRARGVHLLRVRARENRIAVDFFHVLTDGSGGLRFLVTLVTEYLRACGLPVRHEPPLSLDPDSLPEPGEGEDAHARFFPGRLPKPPRPRRAYQLAPGGVAQGGYRVITGVVPLQRALERARGLGASLTEYLAARYMHALAELRATERRRSASIIRLEVPVDMRRFYPSKTMRNFSLFVSPEIDTALGRYSFEDILSRVHHSMRIEVDPRELARQIARNVGAERNPIVRVAPLPIKDMLLALAHRRLADRAYSGVLSNLGKVEVPGSIDPYVQRFGFLLGPTGAIQKSCAVVSFRGELRVAFGSRADSSELERLFFTALVQDGIPVTVEERSAAPGPDLQRHRG